MSPGVTRDNVAGREEWRGAPRGTRAAAGAQVCSAPKLGSRPKGVRACARWLETRPGFLVEGGDVVRE